MVSSKCAEVFYENFNNFAIECTDCNFKAFHFNDFVLHYQEIHCNFEPTIKLEEVHENEVPVIPSEDYLYSGVKDIRIPEIVFKELTDQYKPKVKDEDPLFDDECEIDEGAISDSEDDLPLKDILKINPLDSTKDACPICHKKYSNTCSLRLHLYRCHPDLSLPRLNAASVMKTCPDCPDKTYSSIKAFYRHRRMKHQTPAKPLAEDNLKSSLNNEKLKEKACTVDFEGNVSDIKSKNFLFEAENELDKNEFSGSEDTMVQDYLTEEPQFTCPQCNGNFVSRKSLRMHVRRKHPDFKLPRMNAANTNLTCPDCPGKTYTSRKGLQRHIRGMHPSIPIDNYQCPHCEKQFKSRERVTAHLRSVHKVSKKPINLKHYPCTQCDRVFSERYLLKRHEIRHTGIRSVICPEPDCGLAFYDSKSLGAHRRLVHVGIKKFVCDICGYSTKQSSTLQTHIRIHTGEKPYKCNQCDKYFTTSAAVSEHKVIHNSHIRPHVCDICGKSFSRPKALYHHKPLHLGIKKFICKICGKAYAQQAGLSAHKRLHATDQLEKTV